MNQQTLVLKFGGAALATSQHIESIADIVQKKTKETDHVAVVVSAMGKTTDQLIALAHEIHEAPPKREMDMLISVGERISMALLAMALAKRGIKALSFTGSQSGIITSEEHSHAKIVDVRPNRIQKAFLEGNVAIVAGFQGVSKNGEITTLGRGGSDTTAVALGIALDACYVAFYKDVPGLFSEDPKQSEMAKQIALATYDEVLHILKSGGKILHSRAVEMAKQHRIPLYIRSFCKEHGEQETQILDTSSSLHSTKRYEI
jgi:aspartate kinase